MTYAEIIARVPPEEAETAVKAEMERRRNDVSEESVETVEIDVPAEVTSICDTCRFLGQKRHDGGDSGEEIYFYACKREPLPKIFEDDPDGLIHVAFSRCEGWAPLPMPVFNEGNLMWEVPR